MSKVDWSKAPAGAIDISRNAVGVEYWTNGKQYWSELNKAWCGAVTDWKVIETRPAADPLGGYKWGYALVIPGMPRQQSALPPIPQFTPAAPGSDWFDWDYTIAIKWPPEGTEFEYDTGEDTNNRYVTLKVMAVRDGKAWLCNVDDGRDTISDDFTDIRPVDYMKTMRERRLLTDIKTDAPGITDEVAALLVKAGWSKQP